MMWSGDMGTGAWLFMVLATVAFWALVVLALVSLFRGTRTASLPRRPAEMQDPSRILDERFARGEIDVDEYHDRQKVLRSAH